MDTNEIRTLIRKAAKDAVEKKVTVGERLSHGEPGEGSGDEVKVVKNQKINFAKILRGKILGDWTDAENEQRIQKALDTRYGASGGFLVPTEISSELIELLQASAVVRQMPGVRVINMKSDSLTIPKQTAGTTVSWGSENTAITEDTTMAFGQVELNLKKAVCLYKVSHEMLIDASWSVDALVKEQLAEDLALAEDLKFLEGTGGTQPRGLYYHSNVHNTDLSGAFTWDEMSKAIREVETSNSFVSGWIMHPQVKHTLRTFKDSNGRYLYDNNIVNGDGSLGSVGGAVTRFTTQLGVTLRPGASETWIVGGRWSDFLIGQSEGIRIDTTGDLYFAEDQIGIRAIRRVDSGLRHPPSFVRILGVQK